VSRSALLFVCAFLIGANSSALQTEKLQTQVLTPRGAKALSSIDVVSERVLVRFAPGTSPTQIAAVLSGQGASAIGSLDPIGWTVVRLATGASVASGLAAFKGLPGVLNVAPDRAYRPIKVPDDPYYSLQTSMSQVDMPAAWEFDTGGTNLVTIADIDTGIQPNHPDLASKLVSSGAITSQFFDPNNGGNQSPDPGPTAACQHGTQTAGVAAAIGDNGVGVSGVSWGAQLLSLRVFNAADCNSDCSPGNACVTDDVAVSKAILYAASLENNPAVGRVVINLSLGASGASCSQGDGTDPGAVQTAINFATGTKNIPIAIAAGNDSGGPIEMPANCAGTGPSGGVMPVGAVDGSDDLAWFTDVGPELAANGVVAPGVSVETTDLLANGGYTGGATGTSFSAPHVAGLMALILSAKPTATAAQVQSYIRGGADYLNGLSANQQGAGRMNAFNAMRLATGKQLMSVGSAAAFPNPFRPSQTGQVSFKLPPSLIGGAASIKIYNVAGEFVRQVSGLTWDGTNNDGNAVASGTYIFEVSTSQGHSTGRLTLIR